MICSSAPLVQPKPSCTGYSPPAPAWPGASHEYFSNRWPWWLYRARQCDTRLLPSSLAASWASLQGDRCRPTISRCSRGGHTLGKSHCWPDLLVVVGKPPGWLRYCWNRFWKRTKILLVIVRFWIFWLKLTKTKAIVLLFKTNKLKRMHSFQFSKRTD